MSRQWVLVLILCSTLCAQESNAFSEKGNIDFITRSQLWDYLSFIASDELEGRGTPSQGQNIAAKFIATNLSRWGLLPAGDSGSYFQKILLRRSRIRPYLTEMNIDGEKFSFGNDFISTPISLSILHAPLVFVKSGYVLRSKKIDPYEGIDVRGKVMVTTGGYPAGVSRREFKGKIGIDYDTPSNYAKNNGAVAVITFPSSRSILMWDRYASSYVSEGDISVDAFQKNEKPSVPAITASKKIVETLMRGEVKSDISLWDQTSLDSVPSFSFSASKHVDINISSLTDTVLTQNIVARLPGSDPVLKNEIVAFGAHYDHLGVGTPVNGDSIYNGADDDGSGTVAILAMAEAFAKGPRPKRSLLFVWHTGEEKGLWGSKYFTVFPTVPLPSVVAQLNIDMIGRSSRADDTPSASESMSGRDEIFVIGSEMMSSELKRISEETNKETGKLKLNYKYDDPSDPLRLFYRSDHYNYAKQGIPIVFYFDGIHEDYHKVSDEIGKIDFEKYLNVTRTVYALGWKLAMMPKRPKVDKEFPREVFE